MKGPRIAGKSTRPHSQNRFSGRRGRISGHRAFQRVRPMPPASASMWAPLAWAASRAATICQASCNTLTPALLRSAISMRTA